MTTQDGIDKKAIAALIKLLQSKDEQTILAAAQALLNKPHW